MKPLRRGSHVLASTLLGRVAPARRRALASIGFEVRPAGRGSRPIDPTPILDSWRLLDAAGLQRETSAADEVLLLSRPALEKRVLSDPRIDIYPAGARDIRRGQIDRRVLATLEYLAESGLNPSVSCLRSGHSLLTSSGNISEHVSGNAVDISAVNGVPILGHQDPGGVGDETVQRLMLLRSAMQPHQIISLLDYGANTMALRDHANHVHVGFQPLHARATELDPGQWSDLMARLGSLEQPTITTAPSQYSLRLRRH
jgi:hypothetical protein